MIPLVLNKYNLSKYFYTTHVKNLYEVITKLKKRINDKLIKEDQKQLKIVLNLYRFKDQISFKPKFWINILFGNKKN